MPSCLAFGATSPPHTSSTSARRWSGTRHCLWAACWPQSWSHAFGRRQVPAAGRCAVQHHMSCSSGGFAFSFIIYSVQKGPLAAVLGAPKERRVDPGCCVVLLLGRWSARSLTPPGRWCSCQTSMECRAWRLRDPQWYWHRYAAAAAAAAALGDLARQPM
jgi:hypothetical protein